jgi:hypothetical protein
MDVTKPYTFIGFGAMDVTRPNKSIGFRGYFRHPPRGLQHPRPPAFSCGAPLPTHPRSGEGGGAAQGERAGRPPSPTKTKHRLKANHHGPVF